MITSTELYWVLKLDSIRSCLDCFLICAILSFIVAVVGAGVLTAASLGIEEDDDKQLSGGAKLARKVAMLLLLTVLFLSVVRALIPSTKEYAIIKGVPLLLNSVKTNELTKEASELYNLGINAAKYQLKKLATEDVGKDK